MDCAMEQTMVLPLITGDIPESFRLGQQSAKISLMAFFNARQNGTIVPYQKNRGNTKDSYVAVAKYRDHVNRLVREFNPVNLGTLFVWYDATVEAFVQANFHHRAIAVEEIISGGLYSSYDFNTLTIEIYFCSSKEEFLKIYVNDGNTKAHRPRHNICNNDFSLGNYLDNLFDKAKISNSSNVYKLPTFRHQAAIALLSGNELVNSEFDYAASYAKNRREIDPFARMPKGNKNPLKVSLQVENRMIEALEYYNNLCENLSEKIGRSHGTTKMILKNAGFFGLIVTNYIINPKKMPSFKILANRIDTNSGKLGVVICHITGGSQTNMRKTTNEIGQLLNPNW